MAEGFESLVRPNVIPRIRPPGPHTIADDVGGKALITSNKNAQIIKLTRSEQSSWSRSQPVETQRTVTVQRVTQLYVRPDGTIEMNPENYVDVEHVTKMMLREGTGGQTVYSYAEPPEAENIQTLEKDVVKVNPRA
jgi:hypothetical protein